MKKYLGSIIRFLFVFIISFAIVGYVKNGFMVEIDWFPGTTIWSKLKWYYGYNFAYNLFPSLILTSIVIFIRCLIDRKRL